MYDEDFDIHHNPEIFVDYSNIQSNLEMLDLDSNIQSMQEMHALSQYIHCSQGIVGEDCHM